MWNGIHLVKLAVLKLFAVIVVMPIGLADEPISQNSKDNNPSKSETSASRMGEPNLPGSGGLSSDSLDLDPGGPGLSRTATKRFVQSGSVIISWSEGNDELRGFSLTKGEWTKLSVHVSPHRSLLPVVGDSVAAVVLDDAIAAYSSMAGRWDVVKVAMNNANLPIVDHDLVRGNWNGHLYTFAASTGRWTSPTDPELQGDSFTFLYSRREHADLEQQFVQWLNADDNEYGQYLGANFTGVQPSLTSKTGATRQIMVEGIRKSALEAAKTKLNQLQASSAKDSVAGETADHPDEPAAVQSDPSDFGISDVDVAKGNLAKAAEEIASLSVRLKSIEDQCQQIASEARSSAEPSAHRTALRKLIEQSFQVRFEIQSLETQRMQDKLTIIRSNLETRRQNRNRIVNQRIEQLVSATGNATRWDRPTESVVPNGTGAGLSTASDRESISLHAESQLEPGRDLQATSRVNVTADHRLAAAEELAQKLRRFRAATRELNAVLAERSQSLEALRQSGALPAQGIASRMGMLQKEVVEVSSQLDETRRDWQQTWDTYQAQLELLQLDAKEAEVALHAAGTRAKRMNQLAERNAASAIEQLDAETELQKCEIQYQRALTMLKLYEDLIKKSPELMPNQPSDDAVRSNEESRKADRDSVESEPNRVHQN